MCWPVLLSFVALLAMENFNDWTWDCQVCNQLVSYGDYFLCVAIDGSIWIGRSPPSSQFPYRSFVKMTVLEKSMTWSGWHSVSDATIVGIMDPYPSMAELKDNARRRRVTHFLFHGSLPLSDYAFQGCFHSDGQGFDPRSNGLRIFFAPRSTSPTNCNHKKYIWLFCVYDGWI